MLASLVARTTVPRQSIRAASFPKTANGTAQRISICVSGSKKWSHRKRTPEELMFSVVPCHHSDFPLIRYRSGVWIVKRWARWRTSLAALAEGLNIFKITPPKTLETASKLTGLRTLGNRTLVAFLVAQWVQ